MFTQALVTLMVKDLKTSLDFYTTKLGMQVKTNIEGEWIELTLPGLTLALHPAFMELQPGTASVGFSVLQLEQAISDLEKKGLSFTIHEEGFIRLALFKDPDGYNLYLYEMMG